MCNHSYLAKLILSIKKKFLIANYTLSDLSRGGEGLIDLIALVPVNHRINSTPRLSVEMSWKRLLRSITDYKI